MELDDFVKKFANLFDDTNPENITPKTEFHMLDEWSSLTGMGVIALLKIEYGKTITGKEIRECETVEDLFNLIAK